MTDIVPTSTPEPSVDTVVTSEAKQVVVSLQDRVKNWLQDLYNHNKFLFYTVIPLMGLVYLVIKYRDLLIDILLGSAKNVDKKAQAEDQSLKAKADSTNAQANSLENEASKLENEADRLSKEQTPVNEDWNKK